MFENLVPPILKYNITKTAFITSGQKEPFLGNGLASFTTSSLVEINCKINSSLSTSKQLLPQPSLSV